MALSSKEESLIDVLKHNTIPVMVCVTQNCILKNEKILEKGQCVTILKKKNIQLVFGKTWDNQTFRIFFNVQKPLLLDTVDEFYPASVTEFYNMSKDISYIQIKKTYMLELQTFLPGEIFRIDYYTKNEDSLLIIRERNNVKFPVPFEILFDKSLFVFVGVKERLGLQALLRSFQPQTVQFVDDLSGQTIPRGIVKLENIYTYETVLTVTMTTSSNYLLFETYNLDSRITVCVPDKPMPKQISLLGNSSSEAYLTKVEEVEFLTHYNIFAGRFYGFVELINTYAHEDQHLLLEGSSGKGRSKSYDNNLATDKGSSSLSSTKEWKSCETVDKCLKQVKRPTSLYTENVNNADLWQNDNHPNKKTKSKIKSFFARLSSSPLQEKQSLITVDPMTKELDTVFIRDPLQFEFSFENESVTKEILRKQQEEYERIEQNRKQSNYEKQNSRTVSAHLPSVSGQVASSSVEFLTRSFPSGESENSLERINPLYNLESPTTTTATTTDTGSVVPSKPLSPSEVQRRKQSVPFTNTLLFNTDNSDNEALSASLDTGLMIELLTKQCTVLKLNNKATNRTERTSPALDSGIDSPPDHSKSSENLFHRFDSANKEDYKKRPAKLLPKTSMQSNSNKEDSIVFDEKDLIEKESSTTNENIGESPYSRPRSLIERPLPEIPVSFAASPASDNTQTDVENFYYEIKDIETENFNIMSTYSIAQVGAVLKGIQLASFVSEFSKHMINGKLLLKLIEKPEFGKDLTLNRFEQYKLIKYVKYGWRPKTADIPSDEINKFDTIDWSVKDVFNQMKMINLKAFGTFCAEHQVDGSLLKDLIDNDITSSLREDYGIHLNIVEYERLKGFVNKEIKYTTGERIKSDKTSKQYNT